MTNTTSVRSQFETKALPVFLNRSPSQQVILIASPPNGTLNRGPVCYKAARKIFFGKPKQRGEKSLLSPPPTPDKIARTESTSFPLETIASLPSTALTLRHSELNRFFTNITFLVLLRPSTKSTGQWTLNPNHTATLS